MGKNQRSHNLDYSPPPQAQTVSIEGVYNMYINDTFHVVGHIHMNKELRHTRFYIQDIPQ
jgi:hypothetical protein